jgi:hypothetical protein
MPHPNSLKNLRPPWKPGQVPNPEGINRKRSYTDRLHEVAETLLPAELREKINSAFERQFGKKDLLPPTATYADAECLRLHLSVLMKGDVNAAAFISDRIEGRPPNRLDLVGHERQEITIRVVEDPPMPPRGRDQVEARLYHDIITLVEVSPDSEDESLLTTAANLAQLIKARAKQKGKVLDVPAR